MYSPLEQFEIYPVRPLRRGARDRSVTNSVRRRRRTVTRWITWGRRVRVDGRGRVVPSRWQRMREGSQQRVRGMRGQTRGPQGMRFYPFVSSRFRLVLGCNLRGLIPYSFTVTSHLIVTRARATVIWRGKLIIGLRRHGRKLFGRFLPAGTPRGMIPFMVPLEVLGFGITVISLSVRLFANMMAGHILLKVIAGFAWTRMERGGRRYRAHRVPRRVLLALRALETAVAFIQAYVFTLLTCIYTADVVHGGH